MRRRHDSLHIRHGSVHIQCTSGSTRDVKPSCGKYHGQCSHGQCDAVRHVLVSGQSYGGIGYGSGTRGTDSHAVHTGLYRTVGSRFTDSFGGRKARIEQFMQTDVYVRRSDINYQSGDDQYTGAVEACRRNLMSEAAMRKGHRNEG